MRMKLFKVVVTPVFHLLDDDGNISDECTGTSVQMFPGKFLTLDKFAEIVEEQVNKDTDQIQALYKRPIVNA